MEKIGTGYGAGTGDGYGSDTGGGYGDGTGGSGFGTGSGTGDGYGYGYGCGCGSGFGTGTGYGSGTGEDFRDWEMVNKLKVSDQAARTVDFLINKSYGARAVQWKGSGFSETIEKDEELKKAIEDLEASE